MRNLKTKLFYFLHLLIGVHHLPSHPRRRVEDFRGNDFAQSLFDSKFSAKVCRAVLNTYFFEKIIANTLAPEEYGRYMVQHVAWVYNAASVFDFAAEEMQGQSPPDFPLYYRRWSRDYATDSSVFKSEWNLRNTTALDTGPAAATYLAYQKHLSQFDPEYLVIGFLPCDMLRSWVANKINDQVPETHVYRSWVDQNLRDGSSKTQTLVNKYFSKDDDWKYCQDIFNEGMINELNFFRSVCGEELVDYVFGD